MSAPDRGQVWEGLGEPDDQVGSVNDPRTLEEYGQRFNEKWVYLGESGDVARVVLWNRYDLVAILRVKPDGSSEPEPLLEA